ncbi:lysophospholipase [Primorskyibacter flagellatus]|uniref:Lysophospholipase n=1 Tax=Primorskyibacter flagellatus TaxID=1387277 RepID=A0A917A287_9RHOB|nr:SGNH/GDSL hydrolase family protein [Primorskyibacter flagellatus]GGE21825.1 lysophospholipase [Primorskyibacter flagellatus]
MFSTFSHTLSATALGLLLAGPAAAVGIGPFSDLIVFGDSYSDSGNASITTFGLVPNPTRYPNGQFTNGDVWATQLGATAALAGGTNYAFGGAEAQGEAGDLIPDFGLQIDSFLLSLAGGLSLGPTPVVGMFIGGNDLREIPDSASAPGVIADTVGAIGTGMQRLIDAGLGDFVVFGMPNLGRLPENAAPGDAASGTAAALAYNAALTARFGTLTGAHDIRYIDTFALLEGVFADAAALGFTNTTEGCIDAEANPALCSGDLGYLFQDNVHVTERVQTVLADAFTDAVMPAVPLPAGGLLILSGLGALTLLRRRA